jgi:mono/diheme cytochrome c family protein
MNIYTGAAIAMLALGPLAPANADESAVHLKDAPEAVTVRAHCSICHSVDYIQMNAPFMKKAGWEAEVRKMMKVMGAPVPEEEAARIVDYLTKNYGIE